VVYLAESYGGDNENHYPKLEEQRCLNREKITWVNGRQNKNISKYTFVTIEDVKKKSKDRKINKNNMKIEEEGVIYDCKFCGIFHMQSNCSSCKLDGIT
jgi:hypothetical protein